jgi:SulP family sulfate permease
MPQSTHFLVDLWRALGDARAPHLVSALFGGGALIALVLLRRFAPRLPGVLVVVAAATALSAATGFAERGGAVIGAIPAGLPEFGLPAFEWNAAIEPASRRSISTSPRRMRPSRS